MAKPNLSIARKQAIKEVDSSGIKTFRKYSTYLQDRFGFKVLKIPLDGGFSCPNRDGLKGFKGCLFCDNHAFSPVVGSNLTIPQQLSAGIARSPDRYKAFIGYFQPYSGTYAPVEKLARLYREAIDHPRVVGLAIGTRPDCIPKPVLDQLARLNSLTYLSLEIGVQSLHDRTLKDINRGHTAQDSLEAIRRLKDEGIECIAHLILGLPGETEDMVLETALKISEAGVDGIKLHQLMVIRDTPMALSWTRGEFCTLKLEEYARLVAMILSKIDPEIILHRLSADCSAQNGLLSPLWSSDKGKTSNKIAMELKKLRISLL